MKFSHTMHGYTTVMYNSCYIVKKKTSTFWNKQDKLSPVNVYGETPETKKPLVSNGVEAIDQVSYL